MSDPSVRILRLRIEPRGAAGAVRRNRSRGADHARRGAQPGPGAHRAADRAARPQVPRLPAARCPVARRLQDRPAERLHVGGGGRGRAVPGKAERSRRSRWRWSTSTTSRWSTTPTATWSATGSSSPSPRRSRASSRDYDRAGRFGGEEFVLLLAQTSEADACKIAERLRAHVAGTGGPGRRPPERPDRPGDDLDRRDGHGQRARSPELTDLLAAADSALYHAKQTGRNRIATRAAESNMGLDAEFGGHRTGDVRVDPTGASLRLSRLLCVSTKARHGAAIASAQTDARAAYRQARRRRYCE